jgi:hypothetical protein
MIQCLMTMLYLEGFFWTLIFYVLAIDFQRVLVVTKPLDNRQ